MMLIVIPPKCVNLLLRIRQRCEPMHVQTFFAEASVERFDDGVVRGLASPAEVENDAIGIRPEVHRRTDEFRTVVAVDPLRQAASKRRRSRVATTSRPLRP